MEPLKKFGILFLMVTNKPSNKPSQREFYSLKNTHKIPCLGR
jgi:hypothetical protein